MNLKLACADFTFPLLPHGRVLELIAMLEFKGVDVGRFEGRSHLWPSREFGNVGRSARRLKRKLDDVGLKAADIFLQTAEDFVPYAINHPVAARRRRARDWYLKTLDYAAGCGSRHVTVLPGAQFPEREPRRDSYARMRHELEWRLEQARPYRIRCAVEAHVGSIVPRPKAAAKLVEDVPGLTLTLDYTHFTRAGLDDAAVEPLIASASHFHVRGARRGRLQENFSRNTIDYKRVYRTMQTTGYKGWVGIEYVWTEWERCNECDNLSETIRFRDFFRSLARQR